MTLRSVSCPRRGTRLGRRGAPTTAFASSQLFGSQAIVVLQGSYHRDRNELDCARWRALHELHLRWTARRTVRAFIRRSPSPSPEATGTSAPSTTTTPPPASSSQGAHATTRETTRSRRAPTIMDGQTDAIGLLRPESSRSHLQRVRADLLRSRFLCREPGRFRPSFPNFEGARRSLDYGVYLQDSWRAAPGLTVDVGLRWDGETDAQLRGQTVLRFSNEWQPRVGDRLGPLARRRDQGLRVRRPLLLRAADGRGGDGVQQHHDRRRPTISTRSVAQDPNVHLVSTAHRVRRVPYGDSVDAGLKASSMDELTLGCRAARSVPSADRRRSRARTAASIDVIEDRCDFD